VEQEQVHYACFLGKLAFTTSLAWSPELFFDDLPERGDRLVRGEVCSLLDEEG
jgi:hypothetical protein